jgi:hypothetical protein
MSERFTVTEPGVYDIDEDIYHRDPVPGGSLSSTGARAILPPGTPARFRWDLDHPVHKDVFDFGTAAHHIVLGTGPKIAVVDAPDWRSKAAQDQRSAAWAEGAVPLLVDDYETVLAMATVMRRHAITGPLFANPGNAEQSLFWTDQETGVWCRARPDWIPEGVMAGRRIAVDYKTTRAADEASLAKAVADYGYAQQADWYLDGMRALGFGDNPAFVFVFQEKSSPFLIHVVELDAVAMRIGAAKNRRARQIYAECKAAGEWPGYPTEVTSLSLPVWAENRDAEEYL